MTVYEPISWKPWKEEEERDWLFGVKLQELWNMKRKMTTVYCCELPPKRWQAVVNLSKTTLSPLVSFPFFLPSFFLFPPLCLLCLLWFLRLIFTLLLFLVCLRHSPRLALVPLSLPLPPPLPLALTPSPLPPPLPLCLPAACLSLCFHYGAPKRLLPVLPNRWTSSRPLVPLDITRFYLPRFYCCVEEKREIALYYVQHISASQLIRWWTAAALSNSSWRIVEYFRFQDCEVNCRNCVFDQSDKLIYKMFSVDSWSDFLEVDFRFVKSSQ